MISTTRFDRICKACLQVATLTILLASATWLAGCAAAPVQYRPVLLPQPARPVLTSLKASDLQCLSDSAYTTIVNRERAYKTWGLQLEAIIDANNAKAGGGK